MSKRLQPLLGEIHQGDCVEGLKNIPDESVHLAFADPPFNIGYEYDEYDDRLESEKYVEWSGKWMREVHRVLRPAGSFWLAIGDEYAAELKIEAQSSGFQARNWVIWYYTFGVHCKTKFTRSHAHLFYFVKDSKRFTFNRDAVAVPSARQLVYRDARANPAGRTPDDTWILRPQDCIDGFTPDEDMWYFPRVAGTFKERAGFHGCQMPEQLLGRIIRACSDPDDVVLDPFSGSSTTLTVAKKLGRQFVGFELSKEYAKLGRKRLNSACVGDLLEGAEEPKVSAPATNAAKGSKAKGSKAKGSKAKRSKAKDAKSSGAQPTFAFAGGSPNASDRSVGDTASEADSDRSNLAEMRSESDAIIAACAAAHQGYSIDRLIADPMMHDDFQQQCDQRSVPGTAAERNRFLFRLRKSGVLKGAGIETTVRTSIEWKEMEPYAFAAEIAWQQVSEIYAQASLDEIFCDPRLAKSFDTIASGFSPGFSPLEYRWAALKLRKEQKQGRDRASRVSLEELGIRKFDDRDAHRLHEFDFESLAESPGVYALRDAGGKYLYAGETCDLKTRLKAQFCEAAQMGWPDMAVDRQLLELLLLDVSSVSDWRLARQSKLLEWYDPQWNRSHVIAA